MKKPEIAKRMASQSGLTEGEAADQLDRMVRQILANLRKGREAPLPGLGTFTHDPEGKIIFELERDKSRD